MSQNQHQKEHFYRELKRLVVPITIQNFMLSLVSATDAIMLGFVDQLSLSAVSLAGQIQFILNMVVTGVAAGAAILLAQYWGKQDRETIGKIGPIALRINLTASGLFTVLSAFVPRFLMSIYTNDPELIAAGSAYLRAVALSYVFCGISQVYLTLLKNTGEAALASRISSTTVVLNIFLNAVLIFGLLGAPKLGILGAAYATVLSRGIELAWSVLETFRKNRVGLRWSYMFYGYGELEKDFIRYTSPCLGAALVWGGAFSLYSVILGHLGSDAVAANSIVSIIRGVVNSGSRGLSGGTGIMIGNALGAGQMDRAESWSKRLVKLSIVFGLANLVLMCVMIPLSGLIPTLSPRAVELMKVMLVISGVNLAFMSFNTVVLDGVFYAGGDSKFDMIGNIFTMWCFTVPAGFLAAFYFRLPIPVVYAVISLDEIVKIPAVWGHYKKKLWLRNITR